LAHPPKRLRRLTLKGAQPAARQSRFRGYLANSLAVDETQSCTMAASVQSCKDSEEQNVNAPDRAALAAPERHLFVVEWRDGFKIGIAQVDAEHRHLFTLVKALNLANIDGTLSELLDYVVTHFTHEQEAMETSGFPDFRQHLALHEQFSAQVADFLSSGSEWTEERVQELRRFLNKWLVGHILTHDLRFGRWYQEHGRQHQYAQPVVAQQRPRVGWFDRFLGRG
jgi:hemerythrin